MNSVMRTELPPSTKTVVDAVLRLWPEHAGFLAKSFDERDASTMALTERVAGYTLRLTEGALDEYVKGYKWMCNMVLEEELNFRRTGTYRYASFEQVAALVYSNPADMGAYMHGLLLSQVLWINHARSMEIYLQDFVEKMPAGCRHLEVGPGHGLLLYLAATNPACASATAWDVSDTSLGQTRASLQRLGLTKDVKLELRNVFDDLAGSGPFDTIVISEVCEHLERPVDALAHLRSTLSPSGRIYVNVPINSPAVDHIYLLETPEAAVQMVEAAGLRVLKTNTVPSAGYTEAKARKARTSMSIVVIAQSA